MVTADFPTTDVVETPVTPVEELTPPTPETPEVPATEAPSDEAPPEPSALDTATAEFLKEYGGETTPSTPETPDEPQVSPEVAAEAQRLAQEMIAAKQHQISEQEELQAWASAGPTIETVLGRVLRGEVQLTPQLVSQITGLIPHLQQTTGKAQYAQGAVSASTSLVEAFLPKLPAAARPEISGKFKSGAYNNKADAFVEDVFTAARKGWVSESDVKKTVAQAVSKYKADVVDPLLKSPPDNNGGTAAATPSIAKGVNPNTPINEVNAILAKMGV